MCRIASTPCLSTRLKRFWILSQLELGSSAACCL
uniref:Uncharacterized protein n=1 Tax=Rhizophora mucronata TaxID=61149 RepID=A0A2P2N346_RHIMU